MIKGLRRIGICLFAVSLVWLGGLLGDKQMLRNELVRLHVVAASDSEADQTMKLRLKDAEIRLYGDRILLENGQGGTMLFAFDETDAVTVLGRNKLNVYHGGKIYQFKGDKRFNGLKYVNLFYRHKNIVKGNEHVEFLGL